MKPTELKREYVRLRAGGNSYAQIADQLHISKGTCTKWERELAGDIDALKKAQLAELCESYGMGKEARIRRLGDTLGKIDEALERVDFAAADPVRLLDMKLKYSEALQQEYAGTLPALELGEDIDPKKIVAALGDLLNRVRSGDVATEQAKKESMVLSNLLRAYDIVEVKAKIDQLEAILGGRDNG